MKRELDEALEQEKEKEKEKYEQMIQYKNKLHQQLMEQVLIPV